MKNMQSMRSDEREELKIKKISGQRGFTLIEILVYAALLAVVGIVIVVFFLQFVGLLESTRRSRESQENAKRAMEVISQEIRHAQSVYTPTSLLASSPGQLSLETTRDLPADENSTFADFYVDDERLYLKRENQATQLVISEKTKVSNLVFTRLVDANGRESVRTQITIVYADDAVGSQTNSVSLISTTALRSFE